MDDESVDGKRGWGICANEPHSATAYSPHSWEACENLADKKGSCEWVSKDECNHGQFLGAGAGVRSCYILLDKRERCLLILKCFSFYLKGPMGGLGVFFLSGKQIYRVNLEKKTSLEWSCASRWDGKSFCSTPHLLRGDHWKWRGWFFLFLFWKHFYLKSFQIHREVAKIVQRIPEYSSSRFPQS